jgi:hypothetical protein
MRAVLSDDIEFGVSLTGADRDSYLSNTFAQGRPSKHLSASRDVDSNLWVTVMPNVLFLDIRDSIREVGLVSSRSAFTFNFSSTDAERSLRSNGHI